MFVYTIDPKGQVIAWSSAGKCNFRGSRKSTAYAAQIIAEYGAAPLPDPDTDPVLRYLGGEFTLPDAQVPQA